MGRIDLHAHTLHSDGTLTPTQLVHRAAEAGLELLAVTDHDTTEAAEEARAAGQKLGVEIEIGCEISTAIEEGNVHVLAYGFDRDEAGLVALLDGIRAGRDRRNVLLLEKLAALGVPVTLEEAQREVTGRIMARPHIARAMVTLGHVPDLRAAFDEYLHDEGPAFVMAELPSPETAIEAVRRAGGVTVVAHPRQIRIRGRPAYERFFRRLSDAGLAGIEVDHPSHRVEDRRLFGALARDLDLVPTGGSDFHGDNKPYIALGTGDGTIDVRRETWERLRERRPR